MIQSKEKVGFFLSKRMGVFWQQKTCEVKKAQTHDVFVG